MSMANFMPESRPGLSPKIRGVDDDVDRVTPGNDVIKERSGLADMLYLRCEWLLQIGCTDIPCRA